MENKVKSPYTVIRELQEASFKKYGNYSHACGYLGAVLEGVIAKLSKKEQDAFVLRLEETINECKLFVKEVHE